MKLLDPVVEREMCELRTRIDAMETVQRCTIDVGDVNSQEILQLTSFLHVKLT
jgi:hypothetical protein